MLEKEHYTSSQQINNTTIEQTHTLSHLATHTVTVKNLAIVLDIYTFFFIIPFGLTLV